MAVTVPGKEEVDIMAYTRQREYEHGIVHLPKTASPSYHLVKSSLPTHCGLEVCFTAQNVATYSQM